MARRVEQSRELGSRLASSLLLGLGLVWACGPSLELDRVLGALRLALVDACRLALVPENFNELRCFFVLFLTAADHLLAVWVFVTLA